MVVDKVDFKKIVVFSNFSTKKNCMDYHWKCLNYHLTLKFVLLYKFYASLDIFYLKASTLMRPIDQYPH